MPYFRYSAKSRDGKSVSGVVEAQSQLEARSKLSQQSLYIVSMSQQSAVAVKGLSALFQKGPGKVPLPALTNFCRQFATLIGAGVNVATALQVLRRQEGSPALQYHLREITHDIQSGTSLTQAFRNRGGAFPALVGNMVAAGETAGILEQVFSRLAGFFERETEINRKVRGAMTYPAVVVTVAVAVVVFLMTFVLPNFLTLFTESGIELPPVTVALMSISTFMRDFWYAILLTLASAVAGVSYWRQGDPGQLAWDQLMLRLPVFGAVLRGRIVARFARTLASLQTSGITLMESLPVVAQAIDNRAVTDVIERARQRVSGGGVLSKSLSGNDIFPLSVLEMMAVGEQSGLLDEILEKVADHYDNEVEASIDRMTAMIEPAIILVLGSIVAFIVIAIVTPMFEIFSAIQ